MEETLLKVFSNPKGRLNEKHLVAMVNKGPLIAQSYIF